MSDSESKEPARQPEASENDRLKRYGLSVLGALSAHVGLFVLVALASWGVATASSRKDANPEPIQFEFREEKSPSPFVKPVQLEVVRPIGMSSRNWGQEREGTEDRW